MLNSHIFMSYVDSKTYMTFNGSIDANYVEGEEQNVHSSFLGGWSCFSTFLGVYSNLFTFL